MSREAIPLKIVLVGDNRVGKTSLRKRYMGEGFRRSYTQTIGADFSIKTYRDTKVSIYDLAGGYNYNLMRQQYYAGTSAILLVFDISVRESMESLPVWLYELDVNLSHKVPIIVLGNKVDLRDEQETISDDEATSYIDQLLDGQDIYYKYFPTSALTGFNVDQAFDSILDRLLTIKEEYG